MTFKTISWDRILVPIHLYKSILNDKKLEAKRRLFHRGMLPPVVLSPRNLLLDGYAALIVLLENGITDIPYVTEGISAYMVPCAPIKKLPLLYALIEGQPMYTLESAKINTLKSWLMQEQQECCYICGRQITLKAEPPLKREFAVLDHRVPVELGGAPTTDNCGLACLRCKSLKGSFPYSEELGELIRAQRDWELSNGYNYPLEK